MRKLLMNIAIIGVAGMLLGCNFFYSMLATPTTLPSPEATEALTAEPTALATQPSQGLPPLTGDWHIHLAQTGGIAGVSRMLEISSNGEMTITEERINRKDTTQLAEDKFTTLKELVAATEYRPITRPIGCADCFIFNLQIDNGSQKFQAQLDQVNLPNSGLEPLVGFLGELLNSK